MQLRGCLKRRGAVQGVFMGPEGVRGTWRLALFAVLFVALLFLVGFAYAAAARHFMQHPPAVPARLTPSFIVLNEATLLLPVLGAMAAMAFLEDVPFTSYGLAGEARLARFFHGYALGLAAIGLLVLVLVLTGYGILSPGTLGAAGDVRYGVEWFFATLLVGFTEELLFRGYLFRTIARGAGFWWATLVTSLLFGAGHGYNPGETVIGLVQLALMGPIFCVAVRATGSIWWGIGLHGAWDYAENFLFGTRDSGNPCFGTLMELAPHGNVYWSGGLTGPEGSVFGLGLAVVIGGYVWVVLGSKRSLF